MRGGCVLAVAIGSCACIGVATSFLSPHPTCNRANTFLESSNGPNLYDRLFSGDEYRNDDRSSSGNFDSTSNQFSSSPWTEAGLENQNIRDNFDEDYTNPFNQNGAYAQNSNGYNSSPPMSTNESNRYANTDLSGSDFSPPMSANGSNRYVPTSNIYNPSPPMATNKNNRHEHRSRSSDYNPYPNSSPPMVTNKNNRNEHRSRSSDYNPYPNSSPPMVTNQNNRQSSNGYNSSPPMVTNQNNRQSSNGYNSSPPMATNENNRFERLSSDYDSSPPMVTNQNNRYSQPSNSYNNSPSTAMYENDRNGNFQNDFRDPEIMATNQNNRYSQPSNGYNNSPSTAMYENDRNGNFQNDFRDPNIAMREYDSDRNSPSAPLRDLTARRHPSINEAITLRRDRPEDRRGGRRTKTGRSAGQRSNSRAGQSLLNRPIPSSDERNQVYESDASGEIQGQDHRNFISPVDSVLSRVTLETSGRVLDSWVELWDGPKNNPMKMTVYSQDGYSQPFTTLVQTPDTGVANVISVQNTGDANFPLYAEVEPTFGYNELTEISNSPKPWRNVEGGAMQTFTLPAGVASALVSIETDGLPMQAKMELWGVDSDVKLTAEVENADGFVRPFHAIVETLGRFNTIAIRNVGVTTFPMRASVIPWTGEGNRGNTENRRGNNHEGGGNRGNTRNRRGNNYEGSGYRNDNGQGGYGERGRGLAKFL